jgi:hypothetical protein
MTIASTCRKLWDGYALRSEERRVGKECRKLWDGYALIIPPILIFGAAAVGIVDGNYKHTFEEAKQYAAQLYGDHRLPLRTSEKAEWFTEQGWNNKPSKGQLEEFIDSVDFSK